MANAQISLIPPRSFHSIPFVQLRHSLASHIAAISPFVEQLMRFITSCGIADRAATGIELAVREAVANAVTHGNHEDPDKRVYVACHCYQNGEVLITVRDEGEGFDLNKIPDPTSPQRRFLDHGRGIYLMHQFMDEVHYERGGTVVRMRKKLASVATERFTPGDRLM